MKQIKCNDYYHIEQSHWNSYNTFTAEAVTISKINFPTLNISIPSMFAHSSIEAENMVETLFAW